MVEYRHHGVLDSVLFDAGLRRAAIGNVQRQSFDLERGRGVLLPVGVFRLGNCRRCTLDSLTIGEELPGEKI